MGLDFSTAVLYFLPGFIKQSLQIITETLIWSYQILFSVDIAAFPPWSPTAFTSMCEGTCEVQRVHFGRPEYVSSCGEDLDS